MRGRLHNASILVGVRRAEEQLRIRPGLVLVKRPQRLGHRNPPVINLVRRAGYEIRHCHGRLGRAPFPLFCLRPRK